MAASGPSQAFVQLTSPEEGNWLSLGRALTSVLCQGLRPYIKREMAIFYSNVTAAITGSRAAPCTCVYDPSRKKNQYHDVSKCAWAILLQNAHLGNKLNWKQSDSSKWMDVNNGQWEIAKLFLPDIGGHTVIESAEDMDVTAILNLMFWCNHFTAQRSLIKDVRETRNSKWVHVPKLELSDTEKRAAFEAIEKLLQDPVFTGDSDAQDALRDILALKCSSDVHIFKAEVLSHFKEAIHKDISSLKSELRKESKKNGKQRARVERQLRNLRQGLEKVEKKSATLSSIFAHILELLMVTIVFLFKIVGGTNGKSSKDWLKLLLLCLWCCIGTLDHSSFNDGMSQSFKFIFTSTISRILNECCISVTAYEVLRSKLSDRNKIYSNPYLRSAFLYPSF